jgi:hypothetical protein
MGDTHRRPVALVDSDPLHSAGGGRPCGITPCFCCCRVLRVCLPTPAHQPAHDSSTHGCLVCRKSGVTVGKKMRIHHQLTARRQHRYVRHVFESLYLDTSRAANALASAACTRSANLHMCHTTVSTSLTAVYRQRHAHAHRPLTVAPCQSYSCQNEIQRAVAAGAATSGALLRAAAALPRRFRHPRGALPTPRSRTSLALTSSLLTPLIQGALHYNVKLPGSS